MSEFLSPNLYSLEAEHGVLGAIMLASLQGDQQVVEQALDAVTSQEFAFENNAALLEALRETHAQGMPLDPVTVGITTRTLPDGDLTMTYASEITRDVPSAANWKAYADHLRKLTVLRQVVDAGRVVQEVATAGGALAEVVAKAQQAVADLRDIDGAEPDVVRIGELLPAEVDRIDAGFNGQIVPKLSTGLADLDELLGGGLRKKSMIVIAGRPGSGKTTLGLQIAQHVAVSGAGVSLVFSLEMPKEELVQRSLASVGGIALQRLDDATKMQDEDWPKLTHAVNQLHAAPLYLCDRSSLSMPRIRSEARKVKRQHGLAALVVDYIALIAGEGANRTERIATISTALKSLAKELDVPVLVLAQLNRDSTKRTGAAKKPQASELRDSGQIEQDADMVLLVHRDMDSDAGQAGVTELILDKGRQAKLGSCNVQQQGQYARFTDLFTRDFSQDEVEMNRPYRGRNYSQGDDE
jgi:replicative DNA helicase